MNIIFTYVDLLSFSVTCNIASIYCYNTTTVIIYASSSGHVASTTDYRSRLHCTRHCWWLVRRPPHTARAQYYLYDNNIALCGSAPSANKIHTHARTTGYREVVSGKRTTSMYWWQRGVYRVRWWMGWGLGARGLLWIKVPGVDCSAGSPYADVRWISYEPLLSDVKNERRARREESAAVAGRRTRRRAGGKTPRKSTPHRAPRTYYVPSPHGIPHAFWNSTGDGITF